tara:strand:- start:15631 stop:15780 length:150 start_codon:yes stop_codon:yes gene_type:complete
MKKILNVLTKFLKEASMSNEEKWLASSNDLCEFEHRQKQLMYTKNRGVL